MSKGMEILDAARRIRAVGGREWSAYFNSPIAYVFLVSFLILNAVFTFLVGGLYEGGQADLTGFFFWHPWLFLILIPAVAMRAWAEEYRSGTLEILLTLPIRIEEALLGKFLAAWAFLGLALALTFPIPLTVFYLGAPDPGPLWTGYLGSALLAGAFLSIGMWTSSLTRNQVISFILSVAAGLLLVLAAFPPVTELLVRVAPGWVVTTVSAIGFFSYFEALQRGLLDAGDIAYFVALMLAMLQVTRRALRRRARN